MTKLYCIHARQTVGDDAMAAGLAAAMAAAPADVELRLLCAQELLRAGRPDAAQATVAPLLDGGDAVRPVRLLAGDIALVLKDDHGTIAHLGAALAEPSDATDNRRRVMLAAALKRVGRLDEAEAALSVVLARPDATALAFEQAGHVARARGDVPAAVDHLRAAVGLDPASVRIRMLLVRALRDTGRRPEAETVLDGVLADDPDAADAVLQRGEFALAAGDYGRARDAFDRSRALLPGDARPWQRLASLTSQAEGADAALAILAHGVEQVRGPDLLLTQSDLQFRRGLDKPAEMSLARAEALAPQALPVRLMRIRRAIATGDHGTAATIIDALPTESSRQRAQRHDLRGALAEAQWRFADAAVDYAAAAESDPRSSPLQESLGRCALLQLEPQVARKHFAGSRALNSVVILARGGSLNPSQSRYGALVNDAWCDGDALAAVRGAMDAGDPDAMLAVVRDLPHYTMAAMALLVLLRRTGRLDGAPVAEPGRERAERRIPRVIHQFWDTPRIPPDVLDLTRSWALENPGWDYDLFDRRRAEEYLRTHFGAAEGRALRRARAAAQQADLLRLAVLLREGGVYADADDRCLAPLDDLTATAALVMRQEHLGSVANNFIAVAPGHPVIATAFELAVEAMTRGDADSIWLSTGPGLLSRALGEVLSGDPSGVANLGRDLLILTPWAMRRFTAPACQASYKASAKSWINLEFNPRAT